MTDYRDCLVYRANKCGQFALLKPWQCYMATLSGIAPALLLLIVSSKGFEKIRSDFGEAPEGLMVAGGLAIFIIYATVWFIGRRKRLSIEDYGVWGTAVFSSILAILGATEWI